MKPFEKYLDREERFSFIRDEQWRIERERRRTREERRMKMISEVLSFLTAVLFLVISLMLARAASAKAPETKPSVAPPTLKEMELNAIIAASDVDKPAEEPMTYEDHFRMEGTLIQDCKITHYCAELYQHICGTGAGLTATGGPVVPYWTCAVDPDVIPYGAEVMVEYEDGTVEFWKAQDCGGAVRGNHIDLAVQTHDEALDLGVKVASVYWKEAE